MCFDFHQDEPPLEVLLISVWSPASQGTAPPLAMPDEVTGNRDRFKSTRDEDSLLSYVELTDKTISSILHYSNLRRVGALPVEEALALLPQGTASVLSSAFVDLFFYSFNSVS